MKSREGEPATEIPAPILSDPFYKKCIEIAKLSKGASQRYGSLLVRDGVVIGEGYNRSIAHRSFGRLERIVRQGYCNHAEIEALNDALMNDYDVTDSEIYVGGYFPERSGLLFLKREYTCTKCPPILKRWGIFRINVPTPQGWLPKNIEEAMAEAKTYKDGGIYRNRLSAVLGQWTTTDLEAMGTITERDIQIRDRTENID